MGSDHQLHPWSLHELCSPVHPLTVLRDTRPRRIQTSAEHTCERTALKPRPRCSSHGPTRLAWPSQLCSTRAVPAQLSLPLTQLLYLCTSQPANPGIRKAIPGAVGMWGQQEVALGMAVLAQHSWAEAELSPQPHPPAQGGLLLRAASPCKQRCVPPAHSLSQLVVLPPGRVLVTPAHRNFLEVHIWETKIPS